MRDIRILFELDSGDYYKSFEIVDAFNENYIEDESNEDKDKMLSIDYFDKIRQYLKTGGMENSLDNGK